MGVLTPTPGYSAIQVQLEAEVCFIRLCRPEAGNCINRTLIDDVGRALETHEAQARVVVLEGSPEVFCLGADFKAVHERARGGAAQQEQEPEMLYALWRRLAEGPYVSVAHVRGKVNAGGLGFVAACDVVLSDDKATFSLSEMLFGLLPACVLPFLVRRIGFPKANYLTIGTHPITARQAEQWGLVDAVEENSENLLRKHLLRLRRLTKPAIARYKRYATQLDTRIAQCQPAAVRSNIEVFSDPANMQAISRYVTTGRFPWEAGS
jgi:polyketide biosynthesis enoyl-CoA hydratase PksH